MDNPRLPFDPREQERLSEERSPSPEMADDLSRRIAQLREQPPRPLETPKPERAGRPRAASREASLTPEDRTRGPEPIRERRKKRDREAAQAIGLHLRPEEQQLLADVGKFRVIAESDLAQFLYSGNADRLRRDLDYLRQAQLIEVHVLNLRRDGRGGTVSRFQAVTLTKAGQQLVHETAALPEGQRLYSGLVKRREAEHDCQVYAAYSKELAQLNRAGARNMRVRLDFELKASFNRQVYLAGKAKPEADLHDLKQQVAAQLQLPMNKDRVVVPDARIEYDLPGGGHAQIDIEVATAAYRQGHLAAKVQAGFKLYMSQGDIGRLGAAVQDDHDLMSEILDL